MTGTLDCIASRGEIPKGSETDGITYTSVSENIRYTSSPLKKPCEVKLIHDPKRGCMPDHFDHHVSAARHNKTDIVHFLQYLLGHLNEIFRSLLQGNPAQKCNDLFVKPFFTSMFSCCITGSTALYTVTTFIGINPVIMDHGIPRKVADCNYLIGSMHAPFFHLVNTRD